MLIGPPAVGKSFWVKKYAPEAIVINRDDIVEKQAEAVGCTYNNSFIFPPDDAKIGDTVLGFEQYGKVVASELEWRETEFEVNQKIHNASTKELMQKIEHASTLKKDIVIDMTNLTVKNREFSLEKFGNDFFKIAVVFNFNSPELIAAIKNNSKKRSEELRKLGKEKTIPDATYDKMINTYEPPSESEGFDKIIKYDNSEYLLGLSNIREFIKKTLKNHLIID